MGENMRDMTLNLIVNSQVNRVKDFNKELKKTQNSIAGTQAKAGWLSKTLKGLFGVYFGVQGARNIVNTYRKLDLVRQSLNGLAGGAEAGTRQFEFLRKEAYRTATDFTTIAVKYRNFYAAAKGAGFGEAQTQSMFSGLLTAGRALGADKQSIGGALLAVEQMLSKGRVSMEELRRQLGNAYAGAIQVAARAIGVAPEQFEKLLKKGLSSKEFVPKLTAQFEKEFKESLKEAVKSLDAEIVRLGNAWQYLVLKLGDSGAGKEFAGVIRQISEILSSPQLIYSITAIGRALNSILVVLQVVIKNLGLILFLLSPTIIGTAFMQLINAIKSLILWINATNGSLLTTQKILLRFFALFLILDELISLFQKGRKSVIKEALFGAEGISEGQKIVNAIGAITLSLYGLYEAYRLFSFFAGKKPALMPKIFDWANKGKTIEKNATSIENTRKIINPRTNQPFTDTELNNLKRAGQTAKTLKELYKYSSIAGKTLGEGVLVPISTALLIGEVTAGKEYRKKQEAIAASRESMRIYEKLKYSPMTISSVPEPKGLLGAFPYGSSLSRSETYAPNITYSPQTKIEVKGNSPQEILAQIKGFLDERDRNFWTKITNPATNLIPNFAGGKN